MENNKIIENPNNNNQNNYGDSFLKMALKPNKIVAVVWYLLFTFIAGSIILMILMGIVGAAKGYNYMEFINLVVTNDTASVMYKSYMSCYAWANFLSYFLCAIGVFIYMRDYMFSDFKSIKANYKKILIVAICGTALFFGIGTLLEYLVGLVVTEESQNQETIIFMIKDGSAFASFLAIVFLAPLVEELIYRKAIFEFLKKYPIWVSYLVSALCFGLPHMMATQSSVLAWVLLALLYMSSGAMLSALYHLSGKNIYVSIFAHMVNNLISFILIVL